MAELGLTLLAAAGVVGSVSAAVGGWSLVATAVNNDNIWHGLPPQVQHAIVDAGMAPGR